MYFRTTYTECCYFVRHYNTCVCRCCIRINYIKYIWKKKKIIIFYVDILVLFIDMTLRTSLGYTVSLLQIYCWTHIDASKYFSFVSGSRRPPSAATRLKQCLHSTFTKHLYLRDKLSQSRPDFSTMRVINERYFQFVSHAWIAAICQTCFYMVILTVTNRTLLFRELL